MAGEANGAPVIRWKGRIPKITPDQYAQLRAIHAMRVCGNGRAEETVSDYARAQGIKVATALFAARVGIKRYEVGL